MDFNLANAKNVSLLFSWFLAGPCHRVQNLFIFLNIFPLPFWCAFRIDSLLFFFVFPLKKKRKRKERQQEQQEQPVYKLLLLLYTLGRRWFSDSVFDSAFKRESSESLRVVRIQFRMDGWSVFPCRRNQANAIIIDLLPTVASPPHPSLYSLRHVSNCFFFFLIISK